MPTNPELEKIIGDGKVDTKGAIMALTYEVRSQGEKLDDMKRAMDVDSTRFAPLKDHIDLERRVSRLENAIIGVLVFVFIAVLGALITLVVKK